jgi:hypothetical protein
LIVVAASSIAQMRQRYRPIFALEAAAAGASPFMPMLPAMDSFLFAASPMVPGQERLAIR